MVSSPHTAVEEARRALGARLGEIRRRAGFRTARAFAARAGWSEAKVSRLEHGRTSPSEDDLRQYAAAAGNPELYRGLLATAGSIDEMYVEWRRLHANGLTPVQEAHLTVDDHGTASGPFFPHSAFMLMRGHRTDLRIYRDVVRDEHVPTESSTPLSPWAVAGDDWAARFAIGLQVRDVWHTWHDDPDVEGVDSRLWLATTDTTSWAAVDRDGKTSGHCTVWEYGPRRLWSEVTAAHQWWDGAGRPGPERFGATVRPDRTHTPWLDTPARPVPQNGLIRGAAVAS